MDEMLKNVLRPNEVVLWRGKPEQFETLDKTHKKKFTTCLIVEILVALLIIGLYVYGLVKTGASFKISFVVIVLVICAIPTLNFFGDASKLRKMQYAATNERLLVMRDSTRSMDYNAIKEAAFRTDSDGHVSLLCGKEALELKEDKWRECAVVGQGPTEGEGKCLRFAFYAPDHLDELKKTLKDKLPCLE